jgi:hypothetical protein
MLVSPAEQVLTQSATGVKAKLEHHPLFTGVHWDSVQRLASFDEMVANIFGLKYDHDSTKPWPSTDAPDSKTSSFSHKKKVRSKAKDEMVIDATLHENDTEALSVAEMKAKARWSRLHVKLAAAAGFLGDGKFYEEFQDRLRAKRTLEAKSVMLMTLKSTVWTLFESGQIRPATAQFLKERILEQIDNIESGRNQEDHNPLPFEPLKNMLKVNRAVVKFASKLERIAGGAWLLKPIVNYAKTLVLREFERGYDATVGYYLVFESLLKSHDHGHNFSIDKMIDIEFKELVKHNLDDATSTIAMLRLDWPKLCTALNTLRASRTVLNEGQGIINHMSHEGGLHETEVERMLDMIAVYSTNLDTLNPTEALPEAERNNFFPEKFSTHTEEAIAAEKKRVALKRSNTEQIDVAAIMAHVDKAVDERVKNIVASSSSTAEAV